MLHPMCHPSCCRSRVIIDNWAGRFLDEMNYELEAANTLQFQR
jgi:hypothetical protein